MAALAMLRPTTACRNRSGLEGLIELKEKDQGCLDRVDSPHTPHNGIDCILEIGCGENAQEIPFIHTTFVV